MTMPAAFAANTDIYGLASVANSKLKISDITTDIVNAANQQMYVELGMYRISAPVTDIQDFLKYAAIAFGMEQLCYLSKIRWTSGDVAAEVAGKYKVEYQRWTPMFFMGKGSLKLSDYPLPHQTWRALGLYYIDAYVKLKAEQARAAGGPGLIRHFHDTHARGSGAAYTSEHWRL